MTGTGARAVLFDRYGGRDVLYVADVPVPTPGPGEVTVAVKAAGINPGESAIRSGALQARFPATFPSGEGSDLAGIVVDVGDGVDHFAVQDAVLGFSWRRSSHATHVAVPVSQLIHKPPELSWEVAGSLYVVGLYRLCGGARRRSQGGRDRGSVGGSRRCRDRRGAALGPAGYDASSALRRKRTPTGSERTAPTPCPTEKAWPSV